MNGRAISSDGTTPSGLNGYRREMEIELRDILDWWMRHMPDPEHGGFYGQIDGNDRVVPGAPRGVVLNTRILWTFSAALSHLGSGAGSTDSGEGLQAQYRAMADRAFGYLSEHFVDKEYGGVFWSVDVSGAMREDRKQIYGNAFFLYGLSEYYLATGESAALEQAMGLFTMIEENAHDPVRKGYFEAFARDWRPLEDLRLSAKDVNEAKTTNTHLHVIEAYANLFRAWPHALLKQRIIELLEVFELHMISRETGHLLLFFDEDWTSRSTLVSYGHDIEAAWLLQACAEIVGDPHWIGVTKQWAVRIAVAAAEGLDEDGGLWYESDDGLVVREKHWWPQAEAMVGFLNARQVSGDAVWLERSLAAWEFVKRYIRDGRRGEWFWGVREDHRPMPGQDKAGFWKCPYHNARACLEVIGRLG